MAGRLPLARAGVNPRVYDPRQPMKSWILLLALTALACARTPSQRPVHQTTTELAGTSWKLVKFEGGDGRVLAPDDRTKYTMAFDDSGSVAVRFDCNRGRGTWKHTPPSGMEFGPMALTRAICLPPSLHDELVKRWSGIRSYVLRDGHLFLSMMADGGIFEFEPVPGAPKAN